MIYHEVNKLSTKMHSVDGRKGVEHEKRNHCGNEP